MRQRFKRRTAPSDNRRLYVAPDVPTFKWGAKYQAPRYAPVMVVVWVLALFIALVNGSKAYALWNEHYLVDTLLALALLVTVSFLWRAWEREESYPQLLPKREFNRRYPSSPAAPPARESYGQKLDPYGAAAIPEVMSSEPPLPPPMARRAEYNARDCCDTRANQPHREGCRIFLQYPRGHSVPMLPRVGEGR